MVLLRGCKEAIYTECPGVGFRHGPTPGQSTVWGPFKGLGGAAWAETVDLWERILEFLSDGTQAPQQPLEDTGEQRSIAIPRAGSGTAERFVNLHFLLSLERGGCSSS